MLEFLILRVSGKSYEVVSSYFISLAIIIHFEVDGVNYLITNPGSSSFLPFLLLAEVPEDQEEAEQAKNRHPLTEHIKFFLL